MTLMGEYFWKYLNVMSCLILILSKGVIELFILTNVQLCIEVLLVKIQPYIETLEQNVSLVASHPNFPHFDV